VKLKSWKFCLLLAATVVIGVALLEWPKLMDSQFWAGFLAWSLA